MPLTLSVLSGPNQAPSFVAGPAVTVLEDSGAQTFVGWATGISPGPAEEAGQVVTFVVTGNTNAALFGTPPAVSSAGVLTFTPAPNATGTATITLVAQDNGGTALGGVDTSAPQSFTITVTPVNDAPSFTAGAPPDRRSRMRRRRPSRAGRQRIRPGPPNEAAQTVAFVVTPDVPALFSVAPAVSPTGDLTFTPAPNATGTATLTVVAQDTGGTANGGVDVSRAADGHDHDPAVNDAAEPSTSDAERQRRHRRRRLRRHVHRERSGDAARAIPWMRRCGDARQRDAGDADGDADQSARRRGRAASTSISPASRRSPKIYDTTTTPGRGI